ncbi:hypothetical protein TruAng_008802 [Truncatella angustata]|nr:hypothetical protein TruAng_008802 [Truncatella angustata]
MSSLSIPELIISTFARGLETFAHVLAKSDEWAKENGVDPDSFVNQRLVEDQLPLSFQVQFVSRIVQTNLGRLSGETATLWEEDEKTFQELRKRIDRTLDLVKAFDLAKAQATDFGAEFDL